MAISLFERRSMAKALREMKPARTFLRNLFFSTHQAYDTEKVDVDVQRGVRRLAPFINPRIAAPVIDRVGFTTHTYTPPMVSEKRITHAADYLDRAPGEDIYEPKSPEQRANEMLGADLAELDDMITRREEWMCAQVLLNAQIPIVGEGVNDLITFPRALTHTIAALAAAARWTAATADIWKNLRDWRRICLQTSGVGPNHAILGVEAADALLSNTTLAAKLDVRRLDLGMIKPELVDATGVTYLGRLQGTNMDLWSYDEWYVDPVTKVETPMVPPKSVLLGSSLAQTELRYGAVEVSDRVAKTVTLVRGERVPHSWVDDEPAGHILKLSARPLPVPTQIDAFLVATAVVA